MLVAYERGNSDRAQIADVLRDPRSMRALRRRRARGHAVRSALPDLPAFAWVREKQVLTLEQAVRRITSEPADFFRLA